MRELSLLDQTAFADLVQKTLDAEFDEEYPENGSFLKQERRGKLYWYFKGYEKSLSGGEGRRYLKYVGPVSDPAINGRVERFERVKVGYRVRREIASRLRAAGLPAPSRIEGAVLSGLSRAGIFRLRAVLVGSIAFQTYSALLGVPARIAKRLLSLARLHGSEAVIAARVAARVGHFAKADLVASQFVDLQEPDDALEIEVDHTPEEIVAEIRQRLGLS